MKDPLAEIATQLFNENANILLIYGFNATGKTRLSVAYQDLTKEKNQGKNAGVYYNAFSEDLFTWENDQENHHRDTTLRIKESRLNPFHTYLNREDLSNQLARYSPKYGFAFNRHPDPERGIASVTFYADQEHKTPIKLSRGEERIFVWCFFLSLFQVEAFAGERDDHLFIDDPVSSLDEHNLFATAESIFDLIENNGDEKKVIVTTHHVGLFSILYDWLTKGEKAEKYRNNTQASVLTQKKDTLELSLHKEGIFLYHLHLLRTLKDASGQQRFQFHFVLLRQVLENIASFLGTGRIGLVLENIGVTDPSKMINRINALSHKKAYQFQSERMSAIEGEWFDEIFDKLLTQYRFKL